MFTFSSSKSLKKMESKVYCLQKEIEQIEDVISRCQDLSFKRFWLQPLKEGREKELERMIQEMKKIY